MAVRDEEGLSRPSGTALNSGVRLCVRVASWIVNEEREEAIEVEESDEEKGGGGGGDRRRATRRRAVGGGNERNEREALQCNRSNQRARRNGNAD